MRSAAIACVALALAACTDARQDLAGCRIEVERLPKATCREMDITCNLDVVVHHADMIETCMQSRGYKLNKDRVNKDLVAGKGFGYDYQNTTPDVWESDTLFGAIGATLRKSLS